MRFHSSVRHFCVLASFTFLLAGLSAVPAAAGDGGALSKQEIAQMTDAMRRAYGLRSAESIYAYHGDGAHSLSVPLNAEDIEDWSRAAEADGAEAASLFLLSVGATDFQPTSAFFAFSDTLIDNESTIYFWSTVINLGTTGTVKKLTRKIACPGRTINSKPNHDFPADNISLYWLEVSPPISNTGICEHTVTLPGAKPTKRHHSFYSAN